MLIDLKCHALRRYWRTKMFPLAVLGYISVIICFIGSSWFIKTDVWVCVFHRAGASNIFQGLLDKFYVALIGSYSNSGIFFVKYFSTNNILSFESEASLINSVAGAFATEASKISLTWSVCISESKFQSAFFGVASCVHCGHLAWGHKNYATLANSLLIAWNFSTVNIIFSRGEIILRENEKCNTRTWILYCIVKTKRVPSNAQVGWIKVVSSLTSLSSGDLTLLSKRCEAMLCTSQSKQEGEVDVRRVAFVSTLSQFWSTVSVVMNRK